MLHSIVNLCIYFWFIIIIFFSGGKNLKKNYRYTYEIGIPIINSKHIQLMTNLITTYVIIPNKAN